MSERSLSMKPMAPVTITPTAKALLALIRNPLDALPPLDLFGAFCVFEKRLEALRFIYLIPR